MFAKAKLIAIAVLGFLTALFYGLYNRSKAKFAKHKERQANELIKAERNARADDEAGMKQEQEDRSNGTKNANDAGYLE